MQCAWTKNGRRCLNEAIGRTPYCEGHQYEAPSTVGFAGGAGADPPIIITGGSVTIEFDAGSFQPTGSGRFMNQQKKIMRVEIVGHGINIARDTSGGDVTVKIYYGNP